MKEADLSILDIPELENKISTLYGKIKNMTVVEAVNFLNSLSRLKGGWELPEVAAIEGLLFGYRPCCVKYYIDSRYLGKPSYEEEGHCFDDEEEYVMCKECAREKGKI